MTWGEGQTQAKWTIELNQRDWKGGARLRSRAFILGPRRFFAGLRCVVNGDARQSKSGQQGGSYRSRIETKIPDVRGKDFGLRSLQPDRYVQLLAKVVDNAIDLLFGHAQPS
jgi:hypothetical protein